MRALILGGTSDVAIATAKLLLADKWEVTLTVRNQEKGEALLLAFQTENYTVDTLIFDASAVDTSLVTFEDTANEYDAVFSFIGNLPDETTSFSAQDIQEIVDVNFTSLVKVLEVLSHKFEVRKEGVIVGVSSVAGDRGKSKNLLYASAKAGFTAYLSGLRNKLAKSNVHVLSVIPGFMDTSMTKGLDLPKKLTVSPQQAANTIYKAFKAKKNVVYVSWKWKLIMGIIKHVPEGVYKKLNF